MTVTKCPYLQWQWIFYISRRCFHSFFAAKTITGLDCIYCGCLIRSKLLTIRKHKGSHPVFGGSVMLIILVFCAMLFVLFVFVLSLRCCHLFWIVHSWLLLQFSLTFVPIGSICSALLVNLFLYSNETDFMKELFKKAKIVEVFSLYNSTFYLKKNTLKNMNYSINLYKASNHHLPQIIEYIKRSGHLQMEI